MLLVPHLYFGKMNFLKLNFLKEWNKDMFEDLESKMTILVKLKHLDDKGQQLNMTHANRIHRLEVKKDLPLMQNWVDIF